MTTLFISDLHLDPSRPATTACFLQFLQRDLTEVSTLYILGDLFESWIGDDVSTPLSQLIAQALAACASRQISVAFQAGNRDFLLGSGYAQSAHLRRLPDPCVIDLAGKPVLITHGDLLCTDDQPYQAFRAQTRHPQFQEQFLAKPVQERLAIAQQARANSQSRQTALKQDRQQFETITDVASQTVRHWFTHYGVDCIIHGHTHRPATHQLIIDSRPCTRVVLGDWFTQGSVLRAHNDQLSLEQLSFVHD